jgi:predicted aconitase
MRLSTEEADWLAGKRGPAVAKAMEILVALGDIYGAEELVPVDSVQVAGVGYANLGEAGLEFLQAWVDQGARVVVPTTLNPAGMDLTSWRELGIPEEYARRQLEVIDAYRAMGITINCSCTPYLTGNVPQCGQHLAWSESSAVSYANSVLGARTNREGGPSALAAAITARTPAYGLHLERNRQPQLVVVVSCPLRSATDFGALGYLVGEKAADAVPYFRLRADVEPSPEELKALGAAMAASGSVALYHVEGMTPEAWSYQSAVSAAQDLFVESLEKGYEALNEGARDIDLVWIGCPHASLAEIEETAELLEDRPLTSKLWLTTSRDVRSLAQEKGLADRMEHFGGRIVADCCFLGAPLAQMGISSVATNSAKAAFYLRSQRGLQARFGSLEQCLQAGATGVWPA